MERPPAKLSERDRRARRIQSRHFRANATVDRRKSRGYGVRPRKGCTRSIRIGTPHSHRADYAKGEAAALAEDLCRWRVLGLSSPLFFQFQRAVRRAGVVDDASRLRNGFVSYGEGRGYAASGSADRLGRLRDMRVRARISSLKLWAAAVRRFVTAAFAARVSTRTEGGSSAAAGAVAVAALR
jgi:hypothetical protein